ncbi:MAG: DNA (cytosine-5-)-methyltransferase [Patescibacteria group bacterium]|nr:DNA (cytosine-5-)-methyltransferase [Patescibacteria group bacterium]
MNTSKQKPDGIYNHLLPKLSVIDLAMIKYVKQGGNWMDISEEVPSKRLEQIREMSRQRGVVRTTYYGRLRTDQPAYTISTYFNRPGNGTNIHPWEHRTLTSREAARLQSFPDAFEFLGSEASVRKQIGNAVPPLVGYAVGKTLGKQSFVDLFAGAGGLSLGLEMAGLECIAAQEIDKTFLSTFKKNHSKKAVLISGDITDELVQKKLIKAIKDKLNKKKLGLLAGGPPCQGFSHAGWRKHDDKRNSLVAYFLKMIQKLEPENVLIENVEGLLSMNKGEVLSGILKALDDLGYAHYPKPFVLHAEQYGVPQMRRRVVIIATKNGNQLPLPPKPLFDKCYGRRETKEHINSPVLKYSITVAEALWDLPNLVDKISKYYPSPEKMDNTYAAWCRGEISVEEFLSTRGA